MHRVVRMQRPAHAWTPNGKHRRPSLDEESSRYGRQRHVHYSTSLTLASSQLVQDVADWPCCNWGEEAPCPRRLALSSLARPKRRSARCCAGSLKGPGSPNLNGSSCGWPASSAPASTPTAWWLLSSTAHICPMQPSSSANSLVAVCSTMGDLPRPDARCPQPYKRRSPLRRHRSGRTFPTRMSRRPPACSTRSSLEPAP